MPGLLFKVCASGLVVYSIASCWILSVPHRINWKIHIKTHPKTQKNPGLPRWKIAFSIESKSHTQHQKFANFFKPPIDPQSIPTHQIRPKTRVYACFSYLPATYHVQFRFTAHLKMRPIVDVEMPHFRHQTLILSSLGKFQRFCRINPLTCVRIDNTNLDLLVNLNFFESKLYEHARTPGFRRWIANLTKFVTGTKGGVFKWAVQHGKSQFAKVRQ